MVGLKRRKIIIGYMQSLYLMYNLFTRQQHTAHSGMYKFSLDR